MCLVRHAAGSQRASFDFTVLARYVCGIQLCQPLVLLRHLQVAVGITGVVLDWITSFLTDRTQQGAYNSRCPSCRQSCVECP